MIPGRETLKTIHVGAPWGAQVVIEKVRYSAGRRSIIAQDHVFEVSATWTGPGLHGGVQVLSVRDSAITRSYESALEAADRAAARLRAGEVPELPKLLPASRLAITK